MRGDGVQRAVQAIGLWRQDDDIKGICVLPGLKRLDWDRGIAVRAFDAEAIRQRWS